MASEGVGSGWSRFHPGEGGGGRVVVTAWSLAVLGVALIGATLAYWIRFDLGAFAASVVALPPVITTLIWLYIRRTRLDREYYSIVVQWTVSCTVGLGVFLAAVLWIQGTGLVAAGPLLLFFAGTGSLGGILIGVNRAHIRHTRAQARELQDQHERLQFLNHLLRHNVINKIAIIQGYTSIAAADASVDEEYLELVDRQSEDVVDLVDNVRVLVNAVADEGAHQPVDLSGTLRREIDSIPHSYANVEIDHEIPDGLVIQANGLLRYVFENVIQNAIEHNDAALAEVTIEARESNELVEVTVADNGPGIPEAERESLFSHSKGANHGLGLYLVHTLMTSYGGQVTVVNNEPRGTVVRLTFQRAPADRGSRAGTDGRGDDPAT